MGRGTTSDIVYFEQLGRALAVRGNTKESYEYYEKYSEEQLKNLCTLRDIRVKDGATKEDLIQKLIALVVIDLTNNFDYIKELENNLKVILKEYYEKGLSNHREIKLKDAFFDIEIENQDLFAMLEYISSRFIKIWDEIYEYAKKYYEHHGNLEVPARFKTNDGFTRDDNGIINLGFWVFTQRRTCNPESERGQKFLEIGMRFENKRIFHSWDEMYKYAKIYYEHYGNLEVPRLFKTNDGYTMDKNGTINLGRWIFTQRRTCNPESERGQKLLAIEMRFENKKSTFSWDEMYEYAKKYYEHYGNLEVPARFKTNDGFTRDDNGTVNLGTWIITQRQYCNLESEHGQKLSQIGMIWNVKSNKEEVENICISNNIDIKINKVIIKHISVQELKSKIAYLSSLNIPVVDNEGNLHEIFNMSSPDMKKKYGLSLAELITEYYIKERSM